MKTILIIIFSLTAFSPNAQPPAPGTYTPVPELDKFVGTWKWSDNNGNEVSIKLKKVLFFWGDYSSDVLMGCHRYIKNGVTIEDNLNSFSAIGQNLRGSIMVWGYLNGVMPDESHGSLKDLSKNKRELLNITYNNFSPIPLITWYLTAGEVIEIQGINLPDETVTLPRNLVLIKQ